MFISALLSFYPDVYFHPALLSGNLYFPYFTPPSSSWLVSRLGLCFFFFWYFSVSVTNNSAFTLVLWFLSCTPELLSAYVRNSFLLLSLLPSHYSCFYIFCIACCWKIVITKFQSFWPSSGYVGSITIHVPSHICTEEPKHMYH